MTVETIKNSDAPIGLRLWEKFRPVFSHVEVEHDAPLRKSDNPIVSRLIENGFEVHETHSTFYMGFPIPGFKLDRHFIGQVRDEFQIQLGNDGWLRWRFEGTDTVYLTLFFIHYEKQGQGKGRVWFPHVTDALFRAGVRFLYGAVSPSYYPGKWKMNIPRLTDFYLTHGFEFDGDGYISKYSPYEAFDASDDDSTNDNATGM